MFLVQPFVEYGTSTGFQFSMKKKMSLPSHLMPIQHVRRNFKGNRSVRVPFFFFSFCRVQKRDRLFLIGYGILLCQRSDLDAITGLHHLTYQAIVVQATGLVVGLTNNVIHERLISARIAWQFPKCCKCNKCVRTLYRLVFPAISLLLSIGTWEKENCSTIQIISSLNNISYPGTSYRVLLLASYGRTLAK